MVSVQESQLNERKSLLNHLTAAALIVLTSVQRETTAPTHQEVTNASHVQNWDRTADSILSKVSFCASLGKFFVSMPAGAINSILAEFVSLICGSVNLTAPVVIHQGCIVINLKENASTD